MCICEIGGIALCADGHQRRRCGCLRAKGVGALRRAVVHLEMVP